MNVEQINQEIEKFEAEIETLKEHRCDSLVCTTNEYETSSKIQDLLEKRTELYYQLILVGQASIPTENEDEDEIEKVRHQEKIEIARNLLDLLDDEVIATKTGLLIDEVHALRNK